MQQITYSFYLSSKQVLINYTFVGSCGKHVVALRIFYNQRPLFIVIVKSALGLSYFFLKRESNSVIYLGTKKGKSNFLSDVESYFIMVCVKS